MAWKRSPLELVAVVGEDAFEPPAGGLELAGDATGEPRALGAGRVAGLADDQLGPRLWIRYERRADIHEALLAIGCSPICLKLLNAEESAC